MAASTPLRERRLNLLQQSMSPYDRQGARGVRLLCCPSSGWPPQSQQGLQPPYPSVLRPLQPALAPHTRGNRSESLQIFRCQKLQLRLLGGRIPHPPTLPRLYRALFEVTPTIQRLQLKPQYLAASKRLPAVYLQSTRRPALCHQALRQQLSGLRPQPRFTQSRHLLPANHMRCCSILSPTAHHRSCGRSQGSPLTRQLPFRRPRCHAPPGTQSGCQPLPHCQWWRQLWWISSTE